MAGSGNQFVYGLGSTNFQAPTAGTTGAVLLVPPSKCMGFILTYPGGGTLFIAPQLGASTGNSAFWPANTVLNIDGPAQFYLVAGGATTPVSIVWKGSGINFSVAP